MTDARDPLAKALRELLGGVSVKSDAADFRAILARHGLVAVPAENNDTIRRAVWLAQYQHRNVVAGHGISAEGIAELAEKKVADQEQRESDMVAWRAAVAAAQEDQR